MPKVSVGIIVKNESRSIKKLIESLLKQDFKDYEIVIVDGNSTDGTQQIIQDYKKRFPKKIKLIISDSGKRGLDRNIMLSKCKGKYICVIDAGVTPTKSWISELVYHFEKNRKRLPKLAGMGGKTKLIRDTWQKKTIYAFLETPIGSGGSKQLNENIKKFTLVDSFPNCNGIYLSSIIKRTGYPPRHGAEDFGLNRQLIKEGYLLGINPKPVVKHNYIESFSDFLKKMMDYGDMQARAFLQSRTFRWYVPIVFLYGIYHLVALILLFFKMRLPILLSIYSQLLFFLFFGIIYSAKKKNLIYMFSFIFYPLQYFAYFVGLLRGLYKRYGEIR
ncbi:MAG: glycosyltransferase [Candidatus Woesearchaeota archaeon]